MSKTRRISIPVTEELYQRFTKKLPWGQRTNIMTLIFEQLCDIMDKEGKAALASIYLGRIRLEVSNEELSPDDIERAFKSAFGHTSASEGDED